MNEVLTSKPTRWRWQFSILGGLIATLCIAVVFSVFRNPPPRTTHDRYLFSTDSDALLIKTPKGVWCPDGLAEGDNFVAEIFHADVISLDRIPTDGEYFLALVICLPSDIAAGETREIHLLNTDASQQTDAVPRDVPPRLQEDEFAAVFFAGGCYYPVPSRPSNGRIEIIAKSDSKVKIHLSLTVKFPGVIGEIDIDNEYELKLGPYDGIPLSVRAGGR